MPTNPVPTPAATRMDRWEPPPEGWLKLNVDGSFVVQTGEAGVGVVTAWRVLYRCASADEAEAQACAEGLRLASQWCPGPIVVESDSARILTAMETDANGLLRAWTYHFGSQGISFN